jgi:DNA-binding beta-propeller fold protein YncE
VVQGAYHVPEGTCFNGCGFVFDGVYFWLTFSLNNQVVQVLASTGAVLGTYQVGLNPVALAFDGINIWVANKGSGTVLKIPAR